jgi:O-antigen/teichoic acid export membrane protein
MMNADIWILGAFRTEAEVAIYGTASRLVKLVPMCLMVSNEVMAPLIAELKVMKQNLKLQRVLRTTAAFTAIPALIILVVYIFASPFILNIIYGPFYAGGAVVLVILSIGQLANVWVGSCGYTLTMTGQHNTMMVISFLTGLFTVVVGLAVVDRFGSVGIAFVISFTMVFQQMAMLICAKWRCGIWTHASPQLAISEVLNFFKHYKKNHEKD